MRIFLSPAVLQSK